MKAKFYAVFLLISLIGCKTTDSSLQQNSSSPQSFAWFNDIEPKKEYDQLVSYAKDIFSKDSSIRKQQKEILSESVYNKSKLEVIPLWQKKSGGYRFLVIQPYKVKDSLTFDEREKFHLNGSNYQTSVSAFVDIYVSAKHHRLAKAKVELANAKNFSNEYDDPQSEFEDVESKSTSEAISIIFNESKDLLDNLWNEELPQGHLSDIVQVEIFKAIKEKERTRELGVIAYQLLYEHKDTKGKPIKSGPIGSVVKFIYYHSDEEKVKVWPIHKRTQN